MSGVPQKAHDRVVGMSAAAHAAPLRTENCEAHVEFHPSDTWDDPCVRWDVHITHAPSARDDVVVSVTSCLLPPEIGVISHLSADTWVVPSDTWVVPMPPGTNTKFFTVYVARVEPGHGSPIWPWVTSPTFEHCREQESRHAVRNRQNSWHGAYLHLLLRSGGGTGRCRQSVLDLHVLSPSAR